MVNLSHVRYLDSSGIASQVEALKASQIPPETPRQLGALALSILRF
jgi:hypothetical protein